MTITMTISEFWFWMVAGWVVWYLIGLCIGEIFGRSRYNKEQAESDAADDIYHAYGEDPYMSSLYKDMPKLLRRKSR